MTTRRNAILALVGLVSASNAMAAVPKTKTPAKIKAKPKIAAKKRLIITINKVSQEMTVEVDGNTRFKWAVSTGAAGYETPSGTFRPFRLEKEHFSKEWDDAPMPHSIFFTGRGHAVHGSYHVKSLGRRASHGCVRLAPENAAKLFALVSSTGLANTNVIVRGGLFDSGGGSSGDGKRRLFPWLNRD